jgi:hypothetical protein
MAARLAPKRSTTQPLPGSGLHANHERGRRWTAKPSLADAHLVVLEASRPPNGFPKLVIGSKSIDGGHL